MQSIISEEIRQSIILDREHRVMNLLIDATLRKFQNYNKEIVFNYLKLLLWIPKICKHLQKQSKQRVLKNSSTQTESIGNNQQCQNRNQVRLKIQSHMDKIDLSDPKNCC